MSTNPFDVLSAAPSQNYEADNPFDVIGEQKEKKAKDN